jgi:hypothetical protein
LRRPAGPEREARETQLGANVGPHEPGLLLGTLQTSDT